MLVFLYIMMYLCVYMSERTPHHITRWFCLDRLRCWGCCVCIFLVESLHFGNRRYTLRCWCRCWLEWCSYNPVVQIFFRTPFYLFPYKTTKCKWNFFHLNVVFVCKNMRTSGHMISIKKFRKKKTQHVVNIFTPHLAVELVWIAQQRRASVNSLCQRFFFFV